jgi:hypothetical protein
MQRVAARSPIPARACAALSSAQAGADLALPARGKQEVQMRRQSIAIAVASCVALIATGCATSGQVDKMEERIGSLEQRLGDVERRASAAQSSAEQAAADARLAAQNTERSEAMFKKSVTK